MQLTTEELDPIDGVTEEAVREILATLQDCQWELTRANSVIAVMMSKALEAELRNDAT